MWQWIIKRRLAATGSGSASFTPAELQNARHVLFAVFARYGDSVIAFKAIREFIASYPHKRYLLITTHQALPYARALILQTNLPVNSKPDSTTEPVQFVAVNKRRDPLRMARLAIQLRRDPPDIGFNPWSHGEESEYFASFAKRFFLYRSFAHFSREVNLY